MPAHADRSRNRDLPARRLPGRGDRHRPRRLTALVVSVTSRPGRPAFYAGSEFASLADRYGFIVIYPSAEQQAGFGKCFDTWPAASKVRGGGSDPVSIVSMATYAEQHYGADPNRVYATGAAAINGWSLTFTLPGGQTITSGWNAAYSPTTAAVTAKNVSYNASIAPGATVSIGFQANRTGNAAKPTSFALNGVSCSTA